MALIKTAQAVDKNAEFAHVAQEMYKKNLELAERNKTLSLLRHIDEIVLSSVTDTTQVSAEIVQAVVKDGDFLLAGIYLQNHAKTKLEPLAISNKSNKIAEIEAKELLSPISIAAGKRGVIAKALKEKVVSATPDLHEIVKPHLSKGMAGEIQQALGIKTFYICPLAARNELHGIMLIWLVEKQGAITAFQKTLIDRLIGAVGVAIDNSLLYQANQEANKRLHAANRHLKDLDQAKDEFISMASHQLRTPLTSIKGYLSMLVEGDAGKVSAQQKEFLEYAYGGSQRMVNLISDLLNVSRMTTGKFMIEKSPVDLTHVVKDEVDQLQMHAQAKELKLVFVPPKSKLPLIPLDENKTRQVIMNFVDNAIYYTPKGCVTVKLEKENNKAVLTVEDSGIGVPIEAQKKLFSKFFRAGNAQNVRPDGTGLGLFLAKRVVEDQGGKIIFKSIEGHGSTFGFSIPLK